jgi:hypothetical protein
MQLLEPNEITKEKKDTIVEKQKRNISLAEEEAKLNKELSLTKTDYEVKKKEMERDFENFSTEIKGHISTLKEEVNSLEERRKEAMKPVNDLRKELELKIEETEEINKKISKGFKDVEAGHEKNLELADKLKDKEDELGQREAKVSDSEDKCKREEAILKKSSENLAVKWAQFIEKVDKANKELEDRETKVTDREKVLEIRGESQNKREIEQNNKDREIKDRYETLQRAIQFAKEKYNV